MASAETRLARAVAADADKEWKQHQGMCPRCSRLKTDRQAEPCGVGAELRNERGRLRKIAAEEAEKDKQVPEGQDSLF